jgi:hypothetical protein
MKKRKCVSVKSFVRIKNKSAQKFWKSLGFNLDYHEGYTIRRGLR